MIACELMSQGYGHYAPFSIAGVLIILLIWWIITNKDKPVKAHPQPDWEAEEQDRIDFTETMGQTLERMYLDNAPLTSNQIITLYYRTKNSKVKQSIEKLNIL